MKKILFLLLTLFSLTQNLEAWEFISRAGNLVELEVGSAKDVPQCEAIFIQAFTKAYQDFSNEQLGVQDKAAFLKDAFSDMYREVAQGKQKIVIAKIQGKIIGFAGFEKTDVPGQVYITQLAIIPSEWGNGIGTHLVFSSLNVYEGCDHLVTITRRINEMAKKFYSKIGFTECQYTHEGYSPQKYVGYEWKKPQ